MSDRDESFDQAMTGVAPLKQEARVPLSKRRAADDFARRERRLAAVAARNAGNNPLPDTGIEPLDSWYVLEFKRPGVQNGVYRKLKQGRYETEARLDMHRMTVAEARREVYDFIHEAYRMGLRSLLIVHGRGRTRAGGPLAGLPGEKPAEKPNAVLKGCIRHWLPELDVVQAFHSAQPRHGGTGAVYVLLRKSPETKQENRVQYMKGRVPYDQ